MKSVIEVIPIYPMMANSLPKTCIEEIHQLQRNFIWGDTNEKKKMHEVNWNMLQNPMCLGGLGLRKLDVMNQACLMKLSWKMVNMSSDLWEY